MNFSKSIPVVALVCISTGALQGCGGGSSAAPPPPPQLATSRIGGTGTVAAYSITVPCSLLNGANPAPDGMPIAWSFDGRFGPHELRHHFNGTLAYIFSDFWNPPVRRKHVDNGFSD